MKADGNDGYGYLGDGAAGRSGDPDEERPEVRMAAIVDAARLVVHLDECELPTEGMGACPVCAPVYLLPAVQGAVSYAIGELRALLR
jgi:hypothetical protein